MKDTVITAQRKRTELLTALVCLGISFLLNVICIIIYKTPAIEMVTQIGYVIVIALALYVLWTVIRLLWWAFHRKKE